MDVMHERSMLIMECSLVAITKVYALSVNWRLVIIIFHMLISIIFELSEVSFPSFTCKVIPIQIC